MRRIVIAMVLLGCAPTAPRQSDPPPQTPTDYVRPVDEPPPSLDPQGAETAASQAVAWFFQADPGDAFDAWSTAALSGDAACPYYQTQQADGTFYWYGNCNTEAGVTFDGSFYGTVYLPFDDETWHYWDYANLNGDARVVLAGGEQLRISGLIYAYKQRALVGTSTAGYARWIGDASWLGGERGMTWMGAEPSFDYELSGNNDGAGSVGVTVNGGASGLPGTFGAIVFDHVVVATATCASEPTGVMRFAESSGEWYQLVFDGGPCDGCAELWFRGAKIGAACPDLSPLLTYGAGFME